MTKESYMELLYSIDRYFQKGWLIVEFPDGLKVKCRSFTGIYETDDEPEDGNFIGEYAIAVNEVQILTYGSNAASKNYQDSFEISLINLPERVSSEEGTLLWQK